MRKLLLQDESAVPLSINCWPSASGSETYVNIEYECSVDFDLQHVIIAIPLPPLSHAPTVNSVGGFAAARCALCSRLWCKCALYCFPECTDAATAETQCMSINLAA